MSSYTTDTFTYHDALPVLAQKDIPPILTFEMPSYEVVLFRLLLGTVNLTSIIDDKTIKLRTNYSSLSSKKVQRLNKQSIYDCQVPILVSKNEDLEKYFIRNRANNDIFQPLLFEFSNYFYQKDKKSYIAAFVHLYRCIEHISYSFPLIYAAKARSYKGTYKNLKSFLTNEKTSELKFFETFQSTLIDRSLLKLTLRLELDAPTTAMKKEFFHILNDLTEGYQVVFEQDIAITIHYEKLWSFIINLRNRYFHMLMGDGQKNITSTKVCMDYFFSAINDHVANWIAFTYFETTKFGLENI